MKIPRVKKLLGLLILFVLLILAIGYFKLGGFSPVRVELVDVEDYHLVGRYFKGRYQSDTIGTYFKEMKSYIEEGVVEGFPAIIYDHEPEGNRGEVESYIGILTKGQTTIHQLEKREVPASKAIRVSKDAHISVMPNPDKIKGLIETCAEEYQLEFGQFNIEIYHPNNRLVIERPVISGDR